jgi:mitochondrial fission protein ELM1
VELSKCSSVARVVELVFGWDAKKKAANGIRSAHVRSAKIHESFRALWLLSAGRTAMEIAALITQRREEASAKLVRIQDPRVKLNGFLSISVL